jgi:carbon monoxide dehydrogenase subunit G
LRAKSALAELYDSLGLGDHALMRLESSFEVPASPDAAWDLLLDVPRVVPCMPGAELTEVVDDSNWKAKVAVKLGPVSLTFGTDVKLVEADEAARKVTLSAAGRELRGRGAARATVESSLTSVNGGTRVDIVTDLSLTGPAAQYGRGLVADVSSQLIGRFAECLKAQLDTAEPAGADKAVAEAAKPVGGLRLGLAAIWRSIMRLFRRG